MTDTQLDPELELEAQQLANYEDEKRELAELAEEIKAQDEDFEANKEKIEEGQKQVDIMNAEEAAMFAKWNEVWALMEEYCIEMFRYWKPWINEEDENMSIVECIEYGSIFTNLRIAINKYGDGCYSLFIRFKPKNWFNFDIQRMVEDYQDGIEKLNEIMPLVWKIHGWNI